MLALLALAMASEPEGRGDAHETLVVTGTLLEERRDRAVVSTVVITRAQIQASGARNLADLLEGVAGLHVAPGLAGPVLQARGTNPEHALLLVDGARVTGRIDGGIDLRRLAVDDIEQVEVVFGAGSTLWGSDALGAVVHLRSRSPGRAVRGEAGVRVSRYLSAARGGASRDTSPLVPFGPVDGTELSASIEGGGAVRARASIEHHAGAAWDEDPERPSTTGDATRRLRLAGRVDAGSADDLAVTARAEVSTWRRSGVDATAAGAVLDRDHAGRQILASVAPSWRASRRVRLSGGLFWSQWEDQFRYDQRGSDIQDKLEGLFDRQVQGRLLAELAPGPRHLITIGTDGQRDALVADRLVDGEASRSRGAAFAQHRWDALGTEALVVTSGARLDADSWFGSALTPRVAALATPSPGVALRASVGRGFKAPDLREMFLDFANPAVGYRVDGNADLRPELAWTASVSADVRPVDRVRLSVEGFHTDATDLIQPVLASEGRFAYGNVASARISGASTAASWRPGPVRLDVSHTWLDTRDRATGRALPGRSRHQITGGITADLPADVQLAGRINGFSARTFPVGASEVVAPAAALLDLRAAAGLSRAIEIEVGLDNALDPGPKQPGLLLTAPRRLWIGVRGVHLARPTSRCGDPDDAPAAPAEAPTRGTTQDLEAQ